jgi:hypothetical protein
MIQLKTPLLLLIVLLYAAPGMAGPLATDATSYQTSWHGSTSYVGSPVSGGLAGYIDWAVYAPGVFPAGYAGVAGFVPSPGEYLYAYQAYETGPAALTSVAVVLENTADNIGDFTAAGIAGQSSVGTLLLPFDSATWSFNGVAQGGSSDGLAFFSPNVPKMTQATTIDGGAVGLAIPIPSPSSSNAPEPSTLTLALCGLLGFAIQWLRRRHV